MTGSVRLQDEQNFFITQLRAEFAKSKPNEVLIAMLETLLGMLQQVIGQQQQQAQQEKVANDPTVQAAAKADAMQQQDRIRQDALEAERTHSDMQIQDGKLALEHKKIDLEALKSERQDILDVAKHVSTQEQANKSQASDQAHQQVMQDNAEESDS